MALWMGNENIEEASTHDTIVDGFSIEYGVLKWSSTIHGKESQMPLHIRKCIDNPNATIIIIEAMCIGIVFTDHILHKMEYFRNIVRDNFQRHHDYKGKIYVITREWDTSQWSLSKLTDISFWINRIEHLSLDEIRQKSFLIPMDTPDIAFLEAMSWNPIQLQFTRICLRRINKAG